MVAAPFGVFVADNIQKVQFAFIVNCRDDATARHGVQRFFEWLAQTREEVLVAERARARARIVSAIAKDPVVDQRLHPAVVVGESLQPAVAEQVGTAVADVGQARTASRRTAPR